MKLVINEQCFSNLSLPEIIKLIEEYKPSDDFLSILVDFESNAQRIQASCKKDEWPYMAHPLMLRITTLKLGIEQLEEASCPLLEILNRKFHV